MSRTSKYKAPCLRLMLSVHRKTVGLVGLASALLLPGRVPGFLWRDLLGGLRLLNARRFDQQEAAHWFDQAVAPGYSQTLVDRTVMLAQARFANADGRGNSRPSTLIDLVHERWFTHERPRG